MNADKIVRDSDENRYVFSLKFSSATNSSIIYDHQQWRDCGDRLPRERAVWFI